MYKEINVYINIIINKLLMIFNFGKINVFWIENENIYKNL